MLTEQEIFNLKRMIREAVDQHMLLGANPTFQRREFAEHAQKKLDEYIDDLKERAYEF